MKNLIKLSNRSRQEKLPKQVSIAYNKITRSQRAKCYTYYNTNPIQKESETTPLQVLTIIPQRSVMGFPILHLDMIQEDPPGDL